MSEPRSRPTLQQVALRAGVSRSTAGAALAGSTRVRPETAQKVREVATALGYRTAPHARLLRKGGPDLASVVLDIRISHTADGAMHPFWARLLTGFLRRMQEAQWLCVVQLQEPGVPVLPVPAQGVAIFTSDAGPVSLFVRDTFGQTVVSAVSALDTQSDGLSQLLLNHDYEYIGAQCAAYFAERGCTHVLLVGRPGFFYSDRILQACAAGLEQRGLSSVMAEAGNSTAQRLSQGLTAHVDGLLDLSAQPAGLTQGVRGRPLRDRIHDEGDLVVLTNADGADPTDSSGMGRLSLEGQAVGALAADFFVAAMHDRTQSQIRSLPFAIYPPATG